MQNLDLRKHGMNVKVMVLVREPKGRGREKERIMGG
jgi:hypothetical protein